MGAANAAASAGGIDSTTLVISLLVPLLFRRFLMKRLAKMRGQMGGFGVGGGATIDGSWRDASGDAPARPGQQPDGVIIDQRDREDDSRL